DRQTGDNCVNPPMGAQFYPFYTTGRSHGTCVWQQGGNFIPGTTNHFGGSSTTEYGGLLTTAYPDVGFTTTTEIKNCNSGDKSNPGRQYPDQKRVGRLRAPHFLLVVDHLLAPGVARCGRHQDAEERVEVDVASGRQIDREVEPHRVLVAAADAR